MGMPTRAARKAPKMTLAASESGKAGHVFTAANQDGYRFTYIAINWWTFFCHREQNFRVTFPE